MFESLERHREEVDAQLGELLWDVTPDRRHNFVRLRRSGVAPLDRDQWPELDRWLKDKLEAFDRVFRTVVTKLDDPDARV